MRLEICLKDNVWLLWLKCAADYLLSWCMKKKQQRTKLQHYHVEHCVLYISNKAVSTKVRRIKN